jgi:hypothetical protein
MRPSGGVRQPSSGRPRAAGSHSLVWRLVWVAVGLAFGGALQQAARQLLPGGAVKGFLTSGISWQTATVGTLHLLVGRVSVGPLAVDLSILSVVGAVATYLLLRAVFAR